jgi:isomerase DpgB
MVTATHTTAPLELRVDGRRPISAAILKQVLQLCDRAEDGDGGGLALLHVSGVPADPGGDAPEVAMVSKWERALRRLERLGAATAAVATGDCGGIALDALLAADLRIVTPGTRLVVGLHGDATWPGMGAYRLARQAVAGPVRRAVLLGRPIEAVDALAAGLVDEVTDNPDHAVRSLRTEVGGLAGAELAIRRQLILDAARTSFEDALGTHLAACDRSLRRAAGGS